MLITGKGCRTSGHTANGVNLKKSNGDTGLERLFDGGEFVKLVDRLPT
jgi:hypothetical protein